MKTVTIKRDALEAYTINTPCDCGNEAVNRTLTGQSVGFDFGLKIISASDGNDVVSPLFFERNAGAIIRANRKLSRKKRGSNNRRRAKLDLARLHKHVATA